MVEGTMQEEVMAFRPRKTTEDGIIPEEYEEVTVKPDMEGKMKEVEDGLDSLDDILLEVGERSNKAGGGLAYMLGLRLLYSIFLPTSNKISSNESKLHLSAAVTLPSISGFNCSFFVFFLE